MPSVEQANIKYLIHKANINFAKDEDTVYEPDHCYIYNTSKDNETAHRYKDKDGWGISRETYMNKKTSNTDHLYTVDTFLIYSYKFIIKLDKKYLLINIKHDIKLAKWIEMYESSSITINSDKYGYADEILIDVTFKEPLEDYKLIDIIFDYEYFKEKKSHKF